MAYGKIDYSGLKFLTPRDPDGGHESHEPGSTESIYVRITEHSYVDNTGWKMPTMNFDPGNLGTTIPGISGGAPGYQHGVDVLPSARAVSNVVMAAGTSNVPSSFGVNEWFQFVGQAITHDVAEAALRPLPPDVVNPPGQTTFVPIAGLPFPFNRTPVESGTGTDPDHPLEQINEETSFLDLSIIYGNNEERLDLARAGGPGNKSAYLLMGDDNLFPTIKEVALENGLTSLQVLQIFTTPGFGGLPNPATNPNPATFEDLFYTGDNRVNQTGALISTHLVWAREHNYQVDKIKEWLDKNGLTWSEDKIFEAARAITEGEWQHIVYDEYVSKLVGKGALSKYMGYKEWVDPSIINEWATVGFRFGHDETSNSFRLIDKNGNDIIITDLATAFNQAGAAKHVDGSNHSSANFDEWFAGLTSQFTQEIDGKVVDGNRNLLFGIGQPNNPVTVDLETFDIMRGRDHGVWNYNKLREGLGLSTYSSFEEFAQKNNLDSATLNGLKSVYANDIGLADSIVLALLEKKVKGSMLGETMTLLNVIQFQNLRDGDPNYYENRLKDYPDLIKLIKNTSFAEILERNSGLEHVYHDAFAAHNRISDWDHDGKIFGTEGKNLLLGSYLDDLIKGHKGNDDLYGDKGRDTLYGQEGRDVLNGEQGNDKLYGGVGADVFVFEKGTGKDKIFDFNRSLDKIDLSDYGFRSYADVTKVMTYKFGSVFIDLGGGDSVEIANTTKSALSVSNFILNSEDYGF
jgi:hypothetical protein